MGFGLFAWAAGHIPDSDRADNGSKAEDETDVAEEFELSWFHK